MPRRLWKGTSASGLSMTTVIAYGEDDARQKVSKRLADLSICPISRAIYSKWLNDGKLVELWKDPSTRK